MLNFLHSLVGLNSIISFIPHHLLKLTFDGILTSLTIIFGLVVALIDDISRPSLKEQNSDFTVLDNQTTNAILKWSHAKWTPWLHPTRLPIQFLRI